MVLVVVVVVVVVVGQCKNKIIKHFGKLYCDNKRKNLKDFWPELELENRNSHDFFFFLKL